MWGFKSPLAHRDDLGLCVRPGRWAGSVRSDLLLSKVGVSQESRRRETLRFWHDEEMPKQPLTVELEEDVILAARAEATRKGQSEAAVVEQALREHLSLRSSVTDRVWARNQSDALTDDEALTLAYDELKAMRRERGDSGKAAS
jgi:hypothetical protein